MLPVTTSGVRLFLHVVAATVWVGGQIVLAGLVPVVRPAGRETVSAVARRFQLLAWPAWALLLVTGLWNLDAAGYSHQPSTWQNTVNAKIGAFVLAGAATFAHTRLGRRVRAASTPDAARRRAAVSGAAAGLALLASLYALFWGVVLRA